MFSWLRKLFSWLRILLFGPVKLDPLQGSLVGLAELVKEAIAAGPAGFTRIADRELREDEIPKFASENELKDYLQDIEQKFHEFVEKQRGR